MRILVLGGTRFVGRHAVERLLAEGHEVTLLHRGRTGLDLFPHAGRILGERERIAGLLPPGASWDAVLDANAYDPAEVAAAAGALAGRVRRYVFVSTISVYQASWMDDEASEAAAPILEDAPLVPCSPEEAAAREPWDPRTRGPAATYGPRKAECERVLARACAEAGMDLFVARPAVVFGPYDYTDRVDWWLRRVRAGDAPMPREGHVLPLVPAKDLARALVAMLTRADAPPGAYNVAAPLVPGFDAWVDALAEATGARPTKRAAREGEAVPLVGPRLAIDAEKARRRLGFRPAPLVEALRETALALQEEEHKSGAPEGSDSGRA